MTDFATLAGADIAEEMDIPLLINLPGPLSMLRVFVGMVDTSTGFNFLGLHIARQRLNTFTFGIWMNIKSFKTWGAKLRHHVGRGPQATNQTLLLLAPSCYFFLYLTLLCSSIFNMTQEDTKGFSWGAHEVLMRCWATLQVQLYWCRQFGALTKLPLSIPIWWWLAQSCHQLPTFETGLPETTWICTSSFVPHLMALSMWLREASPNFMTGRCVSCTKAWKKHNSESSGV